VKLGLFAADGKTVWLNAVEEVKQGHKEERSV
jgi:hypothetical protein